MSVAEQTVEIQALSDPKIDFFILADYAEAVNGKLYLMGGAWDRIYVNDLKEPVSIAFALGVLVPWNATNIRHSVEITVEDLDRNQPTGVTVGATFVTGRPTFITEGETQRTILALPKVPIPFENPGTYQAVARIVGGDVRRVPFQLGRLPGITDQIRGT